MAVRPEVLAQLARMLGDDALRFAGDAEIRSAATARLDRLAAALVEETAASDDVTDRESALDYADRRLEALAEVLGPALADSLRAKVAESLSDW